MELTGNLAHKVVDRSLALDKRDRFSRESPVAVLESGLYSIADVFCCQRISLMIKARQLRLCVNRRGDIIRRDQQLRPQLARAEEAA